MGNLLSQYRDVNLLPGAVKYGDLPSLLALCAPTPVRKRVFLRHLYIKMITLPRQARDKHRETSQKRTRFCSSQSASQQYQTWLCRPTVSSRMRLPLVQCRRGAVVISSRSGPCSGALPPPQLIRLPTCDLYLYV